MRKILTLLLVLCLMLSALTVGAAAESSALYSTGITGTADYEAAQNELALLNEYRQENELSALTLDADLTEAAMQRAAELAVYFSHTRPDNTSCFTVINRSGATSFAENIAVGQASASAVMYSWKNSEGHNANMLSSKYKSVGLGSFTSPGGVKYWVQLFSNGTGTATAEAAVKTVTYSITAAEGLLSLTVSPASVSLRAGDTAALTLKNLNHGWGNLEPIAVTAVSSSDSAVAAASVNDDGTVTVSGAGEGSAVLKVGLSSASGGEPYTLEVTVTVKAADGGYDDGTTEGGTSDNGDAGTDGIKTYTLTLIQGGGGSVAADNTAPKAGDRVTVTIEPEDGKRLDKITVTDESGSGITVTDNGDGTFSFIQPEGGVTVKVSFKAEEHSCPAERFTDVPADAYYHEAVAWAVENGVTSGTGDTAFSPDRSCTRAQAVTFIWRAAGSPEPSGEDNPFADVSANDYYYRAVLWAVENGITTGTGGTAFGTGAACTRAQIVTFLYRAEP